MLTAEYEYQEKQPFSVKVGSSDICIIKKATIQFKSNEQRVQAETLDLIEQI